LFLTPFIALFVFNSLFFPFITSKAFLFRILVELMFGAWLVLMMMDVSYRPKRSWVLYALTLFVVIIALADIFGVNFYRSFWSNFERMEGLVTLLHVFAYFLVVSSVLSTQKLWNYFFNTSLGASAIMCFFYGLPQLYGAAKIHQSSDRLDATLGNATYFAVYLLIHIFIALFLLARSKTASARVLYGISIVLQAYLLFFTQTRGVLLGLIGGLFITACIIAIWGKGEKVLRKISIGSLIVLVFLVGTFLLARDTDIVKSNPTLKRLSEISLSEDFFKGQGRYYVWPIAVQGFLERPILGWGQENFNYVFNKNYNPEMWSQEQWFDRTHNVVLDWLIAGGILGLGSYLFIFIALLYYIWRGRGWEFSITDKALFTGLLAAYFFQNLFVFDNITSYILFVMIAGYVCVARTSTTNQPLFPQFQLRSVVSAQVTLAVVAIAVVVGLYFINIKPIKANTALLEALALSQVTNVDYVKTLDSFNRSIAYNTFGKNEAREHLMFLAQKLTTAQVADDVRTRIFNSARTQMEIQITENAEPDARQYLFLGSLLGRYGALPDALIAINEAIRLSPHKQSILFEKANIEIARNDIESALAVAKETFELDESHIEARVRYMIIAIEVGERELAEKLSVGINEGEVLFNDRILDVYIKIGQYDKAISILKKRIEVEPKNAQYVLSLAAAYLEAGDRLTAVETIKQFIALNPALYKTEGEYYIKEIQAGNNP